MDTSHLPADMQTAIAGYGAAKASGTVAFDDGSEFATAYPGEARSARSLDEFLYGRLPATENSTTVADGGNPYAVATSEGW